jgi:hypothetical protein
MEDMVCGERKGVILRGENGTRPSTHRKNGTRPTEISFPYQAKAHDRQYQPLTAHASICSKPMSRNTIEVERIALKRTIHQRRVAVAAAAPADGASHMQRAAHPPRTVHGSGSSGSGDSGDGDSGGSGSGQAVQTGNAHVNASACLWVCFRVFELIGSRLLALALVGCWLIRQWPMVNNQQ